MTLPTFLGIGVHRSGTSWLNRLLDSHPDIYIPARRKEIHFFDLYYERGLDWYAKFFPSDQEAHRYQAVGEITPNYFYGDKCPARIAQMKSVQRLILNVRNPVDRAYSAYSRRVRDANVMESFEEYLSHNPEIVREGFYSTRLKRYLEFFRREQILVLIYEHSVGVNLSTTKETLARFLEVDAARFPPESGSQRVYQSSLPRAGWFYAHAFAMSEWLRSRDQDWIVNLAKKLGIKAIFASPDSLPSMSEETRENLRHTFAQEVEDFESLIQTDLQCWKS
jgi:hypothetical protein